MLSAFWFIVAFVALFIGRVVLATMVFLWILPEGHECPICNAPTLRIQDRAWNMLFPRFRTSWCPECGWQGLMQLGATPPPTVDLPINGRRLRAAGRNHGRGAL